MSGSHLSPEALAELQRKVAEGAKAARELALYSRQQPPQPPAPQPQPAIGTARVATPAQPPAPPSAPPASVQPIATTNMSANPAQLLSQYYRGAYPIQQYQSQVPPIASSQAYQRPQEHRPHSETVGMYHTFTAHPRPQAHIQQLQAQQLQAQHLHLQQQQQQQSQARVSQAQQLQAQQSQIRQSQTPQLQPQQSANGQHPPNSKPDIGRVQSYNSTHNGLPQSVAQNEGKRQVDQASVQQNQSHSNQVPTPSSLPLASHQEPMKRATPQAGTLTFQAATLPRYTRAKLAGLRDVIRAWIESPPVAGISQAFFYFEPVFGWGAGWKICKNPAGLWVMDENGRTSPIQDLLRQLESVVLPDEPAPAPAPAPAVIAISQTAQTAQTAAMPRATGPGNYYRDRTHVTTTQATNGQSSVSVKAAPPPGPLPPSSSANLIRSPAEVNKQTIARDILKAFGKRVASTDTLSAGPLVKRVAREVGPPSMAAPPPNTAVPPAIGIPSMPSSIAVPVGIFAYGDSVQQSPYAVATVSTASPFTTTPLATTMSQAPENPTSKAHKFTPDPATTVPSAIPSSNSTAPTLATSSAGPKSRSARGSSASPSLDAGRLARAVSKTATTVAGRSKTGTYLSSSPSSSKLNDVSGSNANTPPVHPPTSPSSQSEPLFLPSAASSRSPSPISIVDLTRSSSEPEPGPPRKRSKNTAYVLVPPPPPYVVQFRLQSEQARRRREKGKGKEVAREPPEHQMTPHDRKSGRVSRPREHSVPSSVAEENEPEPDYYGFDAEGNPVTDSDERDVMEVACTRLMSVPCKWDGCETVLNSVAGLSRHLQKLHRPAIRKGQPFSCLWTQCGKQCRMGDHHLIKHALDSLTCPYEGCSESFRTIASLCRHAASHDAAIPFKARWQPFFPVDLKRPPLPVPSVLPGCMAAVTCVRPASIPPGRHQALAPWVKKRITYLRTPRRDRSRRPKLVQRYTGLDDSQAGEEPGETYGYLTDYTARYSSYLSEPVENIRFDLLNSQEVTEIVKDGFQILNDQVTPPPSPEPSEFRQLSPWPVEADELTLGPVGEGESMAVASDDEGVVESLLISE